MLLQGKRAIVTGAGSGVGKVAAQRFAEEGASVVVADLRADWAKDCVSAIEQAGGTAVAVEVDVSKEADVAAMVATAVEQFGGLDILYNNVGIPTPRLGMTFLEHSVADFDRLISVNLRGVFLGCRFAIEQFLKQGTGGAILSTGSVAGLVGWGGTPYGATKGGVHQLTRGLAIEYASQGIRVNAICPAGMPYTNFMTAGMGDIPPETLEQMAELVGASHPLGKPITAEDCAEAAVFLVSDRAANITGVLLPVDGGYVAR